MITGKEKLASKDGLIGKRDLFPGFALHDRLEGDGVA